MPVDATAKNGQLTQFGGQLCMASLELLRIVFTENGKNIIRFLGLGSHNWAQQRKVGAHAHSKAESNGTAIESPPEAWPLGAA